MNQFMKAYTIKEVSKRINVPSGTIRQWEKDLEGLLIIPRTRQGARFYTDSEIEMLEKIKQMRSKNLSKDLIRELLQKHIGMDSQIDSEPLETNLPVVKDEQLLENPGATFDVEGFFNALESYKQNMIQDVRNEIRNEFRTVVVDEVKKEIASNSLQTIKALSLSIQRSKDRMQADLDELSHHVAQASEKTSESFESLQIVSKERQKRFQTFHKMLRSFQKGLQGNYRI